MRDVGHEFVAELREEALRGHGRGIGQHADRVARHVGADPVDQVEVLGARSAFFQPDQQFVQPAGALAARGALAAGFAVVEAVDDLQRAHHARVFVHDDDTGRTEKGTDLAHGVEVHAHVDLVRRQHGEGRAGRHDGLQLLAVLDAPGIVVDDLAQRHAHRQLEQPGPLDVAADPVDFGAGAALRADRLEPVRAVLDDGRHAGQGFDVVHDRRAAEQAVHRGKRRLDARIGALALQGFDQAGLLAADVGARAAVHVHVEVEAAAEDVRAQQPVGVGRGNGPFQTLRAVRELAPDVDVGGMGADGVGRDEDAFQQHVGIVFDDGPVLERSGLALVGVAAQIDGLVGILGQEAPFHAGAETGPAPAAQVRVLDLGGDVFRGERRQRGARRGIAVVGDVHVELVDVGDGFVAQ